MKAVQLSAYGGLEQITIVDVAKPEPKAGEVVVRVVAAGTNPGEISIREGLESQPELARRVLSNVWREIGDDALAQGWAETQKARFRPHGLAALAFSVADRQDVPADARRRVFRAVVDEWTRAHPHFLLIEKRAGDLFAAPAPPPMFDPYPAILAHIANLGKIPKVKG